MSFAFGFTGDDISDSDDRGSDHVQHVDESPVVVGSASLHALDSILDSLVDVRVSFDTFVTPQGNTVYRREVFDIKHQIMSEDEPTEISRLLVGDSEAPELDLKRNVYEGGFKLWECSYDLVDEIQALCDGGSLKFQSVVELGCGSALPLCQILRLALQTPGTPTPIKLILSDFNYEVLRLVTVPNLIIHWASTLDSADLASTFDVNVPLADNELVLNRELLEKFVSHLQARNISITLVSGPWGPQFSQLVSPFRPDLILSSETIYSLDTLPIFVDVLKSLHSEQPYTGLVAAKSYYFGVGGSVKEFEDNLRAKDLAFTTTAVEALLKRCIVRIGIQ